MSGICTRFGACVWGADKRVNVPGATQERVCGLSTLTCWAPRQVKLQCPCVMTQMTEMKAKGSALKMSLEELARAARPKRK